MPVIAEPIPTEKDVHIINGYIRQLHILVNENRELYNKPNLIMDTHMASLIYEKGMKILKPIYDNLDQYPAVCIVLMGGLVKLGVIRNFFREENRGNIIAMIKECKDFYIEYSTIEIIKKVEEECKESMFLTSRIKHRDIQSILDNDLGLLIYPIYVTIDKCPVTCLSLIYELISRERLYAIYDRSDFGNIPLQIKKYKEFYIGNRVKYLIERLAAHPDLGPMSKDSSYEKRMVIEELIKIGEDTLKPLYEIIDTYPLSCLNIIPFIIKKLPYKFENFGISITGKPKQDTQGMVKDFKNWYLSYKKTHIL